MAKWYEEAEFYHIYPIGLLGAPRRNEGGEVVHRLERLTEEWLPYLEKMGAASLYETGITPGGDEKLITLSTCYGKDQYLIVQALLYGM